VTIAVPDWCYAEAQLAVATGDYSSVETYFLSVITQMPEYLDSAKKSKPDWAAGRRIAADLVAEVGGIPDDIKMRSRQSLGLPPVTNNHQITPREPIAV